MNTKVFKIALEHIGLNDQSEKNRTFIRDSLERHYPRILGAFLRRMDMDILPKASDFVAHYLSKNSDVPKDTFYNGIENLRSRFVQSINDVMENDSVVNLIETSLPENCSEA